MTRPLRIGLTGGIASGKSTVTQRFAELGVPVIDADIASRTVVEPGKPGLSQLVLRFGEGVLDAEGRLDRPALRALIFNDSSARHALDGIQRLPRARIAENQGSQRRPIQVAARVEHAGAKSLHHRRKAGFPRLDDAARRHIGVDYRNAEFGEALGDRALAACDAAGKANS